MHTPPSDWPQLSEKLQAFYSVWQDLRGTGGTDIPLRRDLSMSRLGRLASSLTIFEFTGPGDMRVKVSGTEMDAHFGRNLSGKRVVDIVGEKAAQPMIRFNESLTRHPCGGYVRDKMHVEGGGRIDATYLTLPLRNAAGDLVQCASLCDAGRQGFALAPSKRAVSFDYQQFGGAQHLDIGLGVPDFAFTLKKRSR
ncbi:PAS domain-containing protein [Kordiimonas lipolytica]|uniref:PAS domain-containing protein n=1 Tax=Kordiimonas lipolytica TaxID=1662421 RepID=A0ABV8UCI3_9PROT|nr:PAS domain-containing protein [Kordiimonas lipolytica]